MQNRSRRRFDSSRLRFWDSCGGSKEAKIHQKSSSEDDQTENRENTDFVDPSLIKSLLFGPNGGQDGAQRESRINFYSDRK